MKNYIKHIIVVVLILLSIGKMYSQSYISDRMAREVNLNTLKLIEKYENSFYFSRGSDYEMFTALFTNGDALVFNDIMPDNNLDSMVSVNNYLDIFQTYYYKRLNVSINPYGLTPIASTDENTGTLSVLAYKIISGKTLNKFNYIDTFDIVFDIQFNYKDTVYKINEIRANHKYGKYCIIDASVGKKGKKGKIMANDSLLLNGKTLIHLDKNGSYILKRISDEHPVEVKPFNEDLMGSYTVDEDFLNKNKSCKKSGDKNIRCISFKYPMFSVGFVAGYAAFNNPVKNKIDDGVMINKQLGYYSGVNFGFVLSNKARLNFKTGIYYKSLAFGLQKDYYSNSYDTTDFDGSDYIRIDSAANINENIKLNYLNIPFYFQKQFKLSRTFFINVDLGGTVYYNLSATYNSSAEGTYGGVYPDLFNVYISEKGFYDFGNYKKISNESPQLQTKKLLFSVYAGLDAGIRLNQKTEVLVGVSYNRSLTKLFEITTNSLSGNSQELNSLTSVSGEYYINEIMINAGINFKF